MINLFFLVSTEFKYNLFFNKYIHSKLLKIFNFYLIMSYSQKLLFTSKYELKNIYFCNIHNIE